MLKKLYGTVKASKNELNTDISQDKFGKILSFLSFRVVRLPVLIKHLHYFCFFFQKNRNKKKIIKEQNRTETGSTKTGQQFHLSVLFFEKKQPLL
jgi:hypothetical protein